MLVTHVRILITLKKLTPINYSVLTLLTVFITVLPKVCINRFVNIKSSAEPSDTFQMVIGNTVKPA